jgi:uncharacterized YccA/Bax inhibitor family protein
MALFNSGNPAISEKTFEKYRQHEGELMTIRGTMNKFGMMMLFLFAAAVFTWNIFYKQGPEAVRPWMWGSMIVGLILALVIIFKKSWAPYLGLGYALCEGLLLGSVSAIYNSAFAEKYPSIVMHAVMLTMGAAAAMYILYQAKIIRVTDTFRKVMLIAVGSIAVIYLVDIAMGIFGTRMPYLHDSSPMGIGISLVIVCVAALSLTIKFDMIEQGAAQGAPKYFEWYCSFSLVVTLVWLYLEMLSLLSKLSKN